jgi:hypothetical protein
LLNSVLGQAQPGDVNTHAELNALATTVDQLMTLAATPAGQALPSTPGLTPETLAQLGLTGVTADNLAVILAAIAASADNGSGIDSLAELQALVDAAITSYTNSLNAIGAYAGTSSLPAGSTTPSVSQYTDAGVVLTNTSVSQQTLVDAVNSVLATSVVTAADVNTTAQIQQIVNAYVKILGEANGATADATPGSDPTVDDYTLIGVDLGVAATNVNALSLLNDIVGTKSTSEVDSVSKLDTIADIVDRLMAVASGKISAADSTLTLTELQSIGLTDSSGNIAVILSAIAASHDSGVEVSTLSGLKTIAALPVILIDPIASDDLLNIAEAGLPLVITGSVTNVADGTAIKISINSKDYFAQVNNQEWTVNIPQADVSSLTLSSYSVTALVEKFTQPYTQTRVLATDLTAPALAITMIANDAASLGKFDAVELANLSAATPLPLTISGTTDIRC